MSPIVSAKASSAARVPPSYMRQGVPPECCDIGPVSATRMQAVNNVSGVNQHSDFRALRNIKTSRRRSRDGSEHLARGVSCSVGIRQIPTSKCAGDFTVELGGRLLSHAIELTAPGDRTAVSCSFCPGPVLRGWTRPLATGRSSTMVPGNHRCAPPHGKRSLYCSDVVERRSAFGARADVVTGSRL